MELKIFKHLTNRSFAAQMRKWGGDWGKRLAEDFATLAANAILRTYETNDVGHVNKMIAVSRNVQMFRRFVRISKNVIPYRFDGEAGIFYGKRQKGRYAALSAKRDDGVTEWEHLLNQFIHKEEGFQKKAPSNAWDMEAAVLRLVKTAVKNGATVTELVKEVEKDFAEVSAESAPLAKNVPTKVDRVAA